MRQTLESQKLLSMSQYIESSSNDRCSTAIVYNKSDD